MYLNQDIASLEKVCGEQALGFFKTMIKSKEAVVNNLFDK